VGPALQGQRATDRQPSESDSEYGEQGDARNSGGIGVPTHQQGYTEGQLDWDRDSPNEFDGERGPVNQSLDGVSRGARGPPFAYRSEEPHEPETELKRLAHRGFEPSSKAQRQDWAINISACTQLAS
jgi:hypothetical protein